MSFRACNSEGLFDNEAPTCEPKSCGVHPLIENGKISSEEETFYLSVINIECNEGFILNGVSER